MYFSIAHKPKLEIEIIMSVSCGICFDDICESCIPNEIAHCSTCKNFTVCIPCILKYKKTKCPHCRAKHGLEFPTGGDFETAWVKYNEELVGVHRFPWVFFDEDEDDEDDENEVGQVEDVDDDDDVMPNGVPGQAYFGVTPISPDFEVMYPRVEVEPVVNVLHIVLEAPGVVNTVYMPTGVHLGLNRIGDRLYKGKGITISMKHAVQMPELQFVVDGILEVLEAMETSTPTFTTMVFDLNLKQWRVMAYGDDVQEIHISGQVFHEFIASRRAHDDAVLGAVVVPLPPI